MHSVKVDRLELLEIVRANKEKHIKEFTESVKDYKLAVLKVTKENYDLAKTKNLDKIAEIESIPHRPSSYETNYTRAIRMLELSVEDTIDVEQDVFNQLVLDEWDWKHSFLAASTMYKTLSGSN